VWDTTYALIAEINRAEAFSAVKSLKKQEGIVAIISIAIIIAVALLITRYIVKPVTRVIAGLTQSAYQVASAADEVSSTSQLQSENAAEQAASAEESSASLEEMLAISRKTSEMSLGAGQLMDESVKKAGRSLNILVGLTTYAAGD